MAAVRSAFIFAFEKLTQKAHPALVLCCRDQEAKHTETVVNNGNRSK